MPQHLVAFAEQSSAPIEWQVGAICAQIRSPKPKTSNTQMHKSHFAHKKLTKFATVANYQEEEAQEGKMQVRRRRRGRRKSVPIGLAFTPYQFNSSTMLVAALTIALVAQTASSLTRISDGNFNSDLLNPSRQLFKRQSPADDGHHTAAAAFQNEAFDHLIQPHSNHYEEPLALALGGEDASQDSQQTSRQNKGKRTLYACEEKQLEIECQLGESIQLIRANYGRFSIQICNEHGQLDWKVNCMSSDSFDIIAKSCQAKQSCQLLASNEIFGDACPGTQKYLEVHYQCVTATALNRTEQEQQNAALPRVKPMGRPSIKPGTDVIQTQPGAATTTTTTPVTPTTINSEQMGQTRPAWPPLNPSQIQLPSWIPPSERGQIVIASPSPVLDSIANEGRQGLWCPETMWRSIRWPATEAGRLAQAPCPAHAQSSGHTVLPQGAATLYCKPDGQWSSRAQLPGRCQSIWLRNLTQRLDAGDAPLSILAELVLRSSPLGLSSTQNHWPNSVYATSSLTTPTSDTTARQRTSRGGAGNAPLFGEDLVQMGRIVGRLVDEMGELLARISDDKQRITWAREMIQLIVDLTSNLLDEQHSEAWWDLAGTVATPFSQAGERQRVAGQLLSGLESSSVLLAGALQHQSARLLELNSSNQDDFQRVTEHVYVSIQSIALERSKSIASQRIQVTFPSQTSLMGARWINSEQRFTLNLQVSNTAMDQQQQEQLAGKHLKIVSVMLRGLGAYMEPTMLQQQQLVQELASDKSSPGDSSALLQATRPLAINSDLVGFSIVADSTSQSGGTTKVDLSAPIELVFKHKIPLLVGPSERPPTSGRPAHCVYWDTTNSDWSTAGCKLTASNRTHSVCACDHLTTFGLLNELDQMLAATSQQQQPTSTQTTAPATTSGQMDLVRVHLDSVEQTLDVYEMKPIYMARLLDGNLFASQTGARTYLYVSCSLSGLLLAALLAAAAYNRAHARRLLGSLPAEPPPSLLVANYHIQQQQQLAAAGRMHCQQSNGSHATTGPHSIETSTTNGTSPPTSYSSAGQVASIDLLASKQEQDELNNFYSLLNSGSAAIDHSNYYGNQPTAGLVKAKQCLQFGSRRHLATKAANDSAAKSLSQLALVPCHLIVQMLLLQLLSLLLIESQNLLAWNSQQVKRSLAQNSLALMTAFSQFTSASTSLPLTLDQQPQNALDPLGFVTWLAVFALYYLASALVCWLLTRMVQLSGHLAKLNNLILGPTKAVANGKQYQTIQTISSNALYQQQPQQPINRYGQCQLHNNNQQSSSSPSLSNFSNGHANDTNNFGRLEQLESRQFGGKELYSGMVVANAHISSEPTTNCSLAAMLARLSTGRQLAWLLTHVLPLLLSSLLVWFSRERGQLINAAAYTSSWASQLAYWPLALNVAWAPPLALYLYCLPSICLTLGVVALLLLRRQFSQIYKTGQSNNSQLLFKQSDERNYHLESQSDVATNQMSKRGARRHNNVCGSNNNQLALELSMELKRAKFACLTLLALLALNSICWISFFTHCHQALARQVDGSGGGQNNHLILTFASSNLLISLLVCCSQRQQLKRACQLLGVSRFLGLVTGRCCHLGGGASKSSPASTSSVSSSSYYNNDQQQQQRQQSTQYGTGKSIKVPTAAASQQSLFVISRSRPVGGAMLAEIAQPTYSANQQHQQSTYGLQQHPMLSNQHLYQQLAAAGHGSQQHIYDSTTNLSQKAELVEAQKQHQWNALQLMAQQQQQQQQFNQQPHEPMIHYTLGRAPIIGAPFHLSPQQQQQQHQSQYFHGPIGNLTLKPVPAANNSQQQQQMSFNVQQQQQGARNNPHDSFMCPISGAPNSHAKTHSASSSGRQQQHQQLSASSSATSSSGEADGPLVAIAQAPTTSTLNRRRHEFSIASANRSTSPATFGPIQFNSGNMIMSNNQNNNSDQQQQQQQQATEHRPSSEANQSSDNQSFGTPIGHGKLGGGAGLANRAPIRHDCDQQQHLGGGKQPNYTDALKAAMAQEASQQHFRRTNSNALRQQQQQQPHRSFASSSTAAASSSRMIDKQLDCQEASGDELEGHEDNIYDVANCGQLASR